MSARPLILAGREVLTGETHDVCSPADGRVLSRVSMAGAAEMEAAAAAAARSLAVTRRLTGWERAQILDRLVEGVRGRAEEMARCICEEAGKPIVLARLEVSRALDTLRLSAEEGRRLAGEVVPVDGVSGGAGRLALTRRVARGPVLAITPFNFPLNLVCHKVGPAVAAGAPLVLKPAEQTPGAALMLGELLLAAGWPGEALSVLPADRRIASGLVQDRRFAVVSFTGSDAVGWRLRAMAPYAQVLLELGGNASVILEPDADLDRALPLIARASAAYAGQVCISVQHVLAHASILDRVREGLIAETEKIAVGDPADPAVLCGPLISAASGERVRAWLAEAEAGGARRLTGGFGGGTGGGALCRPAIYEGVPEGARLRTEEVFAPVAHLDGYRDIGEAIARINRSRFGLQTGLFTRDIGTVLRCFSELEVGGLIHDDAPSYRADPMPYGGLKDSGTGREGPRYAVEEFTEPRLLVLRAG